MYLGTYGIDEYLPIPAVTHRFSSGAAYAPTAITYSIYEEGNTTGIAEDTDMTPASPFDSITGLYYARVQLTAAAGYEANKTYVVVVKATVDSVSAIDAHVFQIRPLQTGDSYAIVSSGTHGNAALKTLIDNVDDYVDAEIGALTTELAKVPKSDSNVTWNATAMASINAEADTAISDAGIVTHLTDLKGATFDGATDSNEAIRNRGDAAWVTATGFSTLDAAGIRTAVGLASANLDTQLADIPTVTEMNNRTKPTADYFDPATDTVARVTLVDTCTTNTDMRGTNNAALASVCTETRLSELDAGTAGKAAHQIDIIQTDTTTGIPALIAAAEDKIDTIDGIVDDILVDSGTTLDGKLDDLLEALVYKMIITEANGNTEMFNAASTSLGTIAAAFSSDGTYTTRKKMVI